MGKWVLESITPASDDLDAAGQFGTNFRVQLRLSYAPSMTQKAGQKVKGVFGAQSDFEESPVLDWHEKFTTLWHKTGASASETGDNATGGEYWEFEANMFTHKPSSPTFEAWAKRYIAAYYFVTKKPGLLLRKGEVEFYDRKGKALPQDEFEGMVAASDEEKADIIREYLMKKGGIFIITIHDIPSIETHVKDKHVERLLLFDCGLVTVKLPRVKAMQYLNVKANEPGSWKREFQISKDGKPFSRTIQPPEGFKVVEAPANVSTPNTILFPGEYL